MVTTSIPARSAAAPGKPATARLAFLLLFPGFFFYQTLIGLGAMPALLGGYFSIVSIVLFLPLGLSYLIALRAANYRVSRTDLQFAFFLAYFFSVVAINAAFGAEALTVQTHLLSILFFINIYLVFKSIDFAERKTRATAIASLLLMSGIIFYFSADGTFQPGQVGDAKSPESVATYQGFARSYALTYIGVICFTRHAAARIVLHGIAVGALFLNSSRSELVAVLCVIPLVELYRANSRLNMVCIVLLVLAVAALNLESAMQAIPDSRVWELFDLAQSDSSQARHHMAQQALRTIAEHPLLGAYASYPHGQYAHDILSAWVDLGLFGFAYLLFLLVPTAFKLIAGGWFLRARSGEFLLAGSLICMSLLLLVTAKTFDDMVAGAALGAYAHFRGRLGKGLIA
jgi:hypothetical protein